MPDKLTKYLPIARALADQAMMEKAEVLERLSRQARSEDAWSWKERQLTTPEGEVQAQIVEKDFKPGEAASRLLEHYKRMPESPASVLIPVPELMDLPAEVLAESYRKMLAGGGNGDGTVTIKGKADQ